MSTPTREQVRELLKRAWSALPGNPTRNTVLDKMADAVLALFAASPPEQQTPRPNEEPK